MITPILGRTLAGMSSGTIDSVVTVATGQSGGPAGSLDQEEIRAKIHEILARPEFTQGEGVISRFVRRLLEKLQHALAELLGLDFESAAMLMWVLVYALIVLAVAVIVWLAVRSLRNSRRRESALVMPADPEVARVARVAELRARARAAQLAGDHLLALRLWFTALVVGLGEAGDLDYRDGFTNRELLERGRPKPAVAAALAPILSDLDAKSFGGAPATEGDVNAMARLVDDLLGGMRHGHARLGRERAPLVAREGRARGDGGR